MHTHIFSTRKHSITLSFALLLLCSCEQTFNTLIDVNVKHTPGIAVSLSNRAPNGYIQGTISETKAITGPPQFSSSLPYAKAYIYENQILKDSLVHDPVTHEFTSTTNSWISGATYSIKVSNPPYAILQASDIMPPQITPSISVIPNAKTFTIPDISNQPIPCNEVTVKFTDPNTANNYYSIHITSIDTNPHSGGYYENEYVPTIFNDIDVESSNIESSPFELEAIKISPFYLQDVNFNGREKKFVFYIPNTGFSPNAKTVIRFKSISKSFYKYARSYDLYINTQGNPFSEPVQVYSNATNGAGIFALQQVVIDTL